MTRREIVEEIVEDQGLYTLEAGDIDRAISFLQEGKTELEVIGYMVSWHTQQVQEDNADSMAAAAFEDAAYGSRNE
jgi:hypothetical protein